MPEKRREEKLEFTIELIELNIDDRQTANDLIRFVTQKKEYAKKMGYKHGWVYYQIKEKFSEEIADQIYPSHKKSQVGRFFK